MCSCEGYPCVRGRAALCGKSGCELVQCKVRSSLHAVQSGTDEGKHSFPFRRTFILSRCHVPCAFRSVSRRPPEANTRSICRNDELVRITFGAEIRNHSSRQKRQSAVLSLVKLAWERPAFGNLLHAVWVCRGAWCVLN